MYENGDGVSRDNVLGLMWFILAADKDKEAIKSRDRLLKTLTSEEIKEAEKLVKEWREKHED